MCRKITGGVTSLNLTVPTSAFKLTSGILKTVRTKHVDEDFDFSLAFCGDCGSPIYVVPHWQPQPDIVVIQVGTLDNVSLLELRPKVELNVKHRLQWVEQLEGSEQRQAYTG